MLTMEEVKKNHLCKALQYHGGNILHAAKAIGISYQGAIAMIRRYQLAEEVEKYKRNSDPEIKENERFDVKFTTEDLFVKSYTDPTGSVVPRLHLQCPNCSMMISSRIEVHGSIAYHSKDSVKHRKHMPEIEVYGYTQWKKEHTNGKLLRTMEGRLVQKTLYACTGNKEKAALLLGVDQRDLMRLLRKHKIRSDGKWKKTRKTQN